MTANLRIDPKERRKYNRSKRPNFKPTQFCTESMLLVSEHDSGLTRDELIQTIRRSKSLEPSQARFLAITE